jgi:hypothetical protein
MTDWDILLCQDIIRGSTGYPGRFIGHHLIGCKGFQYTLEIITAAVFCRYSCLKAGVNFPDVFNNGHFRMNEVQ